MPLQVGYNATDDGYIWYNDGSLAGFTNSPSPTYVTNDPTYSDHGTAIDIGANRYAIIDTTNSQTTGDAWLFFKVYYDSSNSDTLMVQAKMVGGSYSDIIKGKETLTFRGDSSLTFTLPSGVITEIGVCFRPSAGTDLYINGTLSKTTTANFSVAAEDLRFSTSTKLSASGLKHVYLLSDIVFTNSPTTGAKLINGGIDSIIDDVIKITESGYADISATIKAQENGYADVYRRVASGGYADLFRTVKLDETARADIERTVRDNRKITESAYADLSRTVKAEESAHADIEREVKATVTEEGIADISRTVKLREEVWNEIERKIPHRVKEENGKMFLGGFPIISVEVNLSESTLSDSVGYQIYGEMFPKDALVGNLLDYNIDMEIESTSQQKGVQSCESVYKMDDIMFRTIRYQKMPESTPASTHITMVAEALGLNPVLRFEDFTPENNYSDSDVTYKNLLSGMFGWTQELPWRNINIFIRDGNLYATQRGYEPNIVNISTIPHDHPQIDRRIERAYEGVTVTEGAKKIRYTPVETKFSGWIRNGDFKALYTNGLCTEQIQGDSHVYNEYDPNTDQLIRTRTVHLDGSSTETRYTYATSYNNQVVESTETHITVDANGKATTTVNYNAALGNGATSTTSYENGKCIGRVTGYGSVTSTATRYTVGQANIALGARPKAGQTYVEWTNQWPIKDTALIQQIFDEVIQYDRKIRETVTVELTPRVSNGTINMTHIIDFNDRIILDGKTYYLVSNTARLDPRKFSQNLQLVRWL